MCPDREFSSKIYQNVIFLGKIGKSGKIGKFFQFPNFCEIDRFVMSKYTSCPNFVKKYWFLRKLRHFPFFRFTSTLTRIYGNSSGYLLEKSSNFWSKAARDFKFCHFMPYMMLKVANYWASRKISSLCEIALPHRDRVKAIFGSSHLWIYEIKLCLLQAWVDCFRLDLDLRGKTAHIRSPLSLSFLDFEWVTFQ